MGENCKVYLNGRLIGFHKDPEKVRNDLIAKRRSGQINPTVSIILDKETNEINLNSDAGRVARPLIIADKGNSRLTPEILKQVEKNVMGWKDLINKGIIEYLSPEEEEHCLVAVSENKLTPKHTHLEISHTALLSVMSSMIPFLQHNMAGRNLHGAKMFKQTIGIPGINYNLRTDTESFLLYYPQKALVKTATMDLIDYNERPQTQNLVIAILPYYGFNMLDAIILNKSSVERGMARAAYFRTYEATEKRYPGGQKDKFEIPVEETTGYRGEEAYKNIGEDGLIELESKVDEDTVLVGRTSPPRFLEEVSEFGIIKEKRRESSMLSRKGKPGYVDKVMVTEDIGGATLAKIKVRGELIPEVGDKFASRHGQKGVIGAIVPEEDLPFTEQGIKPDIIINPHAIPSRMTIGHLIEMLGGKAACFKAEDVDGTPFAGDEQKDFEKIIEKYGFRKDGKEVFYDGLTGEKLEGEIFTGVCYYRKLYHLVKHKIQARARGPVQLLTRQPTEGKEKEGGIRFGEMEGETLVGHGAAMLLQEKFIEDSDKTVELVCEKCGIIGINDSIRNKRYCPACKGSQVYPVEMSYGFKLLLDELKALGIFPKLNLEDKA